MTLGNRIFGWVLGAALFGLVCVFLYFISEASRHLFGKKLGKITIYFYVDKDGEIFLLDSKKSGVDRTFAGKSYKGPLMDEEGLRRTYPEYFEEEYDSVNVDPISSPNEFNFFKKIKVKKKSNKKMTREERKKFNRCKNIAKYINELRTEENRLRAKFRKRYRVVKGEMEDYNYTEIRKYEKYDTVHNFSSIFATVFLTIVFVVPIIPLFLICFLGY